MANTNYISGRNFEYRIMKMLRKLGFFCIRAYASKGPADIVAVPPKAYKPTLLIQAKHSRTQKLKISKQELKNLAALGAESNGIVLIIYNGRNNSLMARPVGRHETALEEFLAGIRDTDSSPLKSSKPGIQSNGN